MQHKAQTRKKQAAKPETKPPLLSRINALRGMSREQLQAEWRSLFGKEPPGYYRPFLIKRLIYRVQELEFGGLKPETRAAMNELMASAGLDNIGRNPPKKRRTDASQLSAGTLLVREWHGTQHEVQVLVDGFAYQGQKFRSLSAIAKFITGTSWNGLVFFGLRKLGAA